MSYRVAGSAGRRCCLSAPSAPVGACRSALPAHLYDPSPCQWGRHEGGAGVVATQLVTITMAIYAQAQMPAKRAAQQTGGVGPVGETRTRRPKDGLTTPRAKGGLQLSRLFYWRPRRDLNPCYRRERTVSTRNIKAPLRIRMHRNES
jgi:hypothetical protein